MLTPPRACIIGHPVAHSRSPLIHRHWLKTMQLAGDYTREDILPETLGAFLQNLQQHGYVGANITIPHKEHCLRYIDHIDSTAQAIGAANTIWLENGKLYGTNTDSYGFLANLNQHAPDWIKTTKTALVIGAGGAARSVLHALNHSSIENILIANRTLERAENLAAAYRNIRAIDWNNISQHLSATDLLVNTTSLGMKGQPTLDLSITALPPHAIVNDIVYVPLLTPLLKQAAARNLKIVDGLGMLLHQAVPGFERWFGHRPEVTQTLRNLIVDDIATGS